MINNIHELGSYVVLADKVAMINSSILIILASYFNTFGVILIPLVITSFFECGTAAVIAEVAEKLILRGITPPFFYSANIDGGDEHNNKIFNEYKNNIFYM